MRHVVVRAALVAAVVASSSGCVNAPEPPGQAVTSPSPGASPGTASVDTTLRFPDVETVDVRREADGTLTLDVTISSAYDTPERYADGWRVLGPDGEVLGTHELGHDHAGEQPFTRTQSGLAVPEGVTEVVVEGRDLVNGYGGTTVTVELPAP